MKDSVTTITRVGRSTITVCGRYDKASEMTATDIVRSLIIHSSNIEYGVDLSPLQSNHVTQAKGGKE